MPEGNRLNREELRDEVKDYLVSLREERVRRSNEVTERLRQLRAARIERLQDIRSSVAVTASIREKTEESFSRERLRTRVQAMRSEVQEMLKQYRATRADGPDQDVHARKPPSNITEPVKRLESTPGDNRHVACAVKQDTVDVEDTQMPSSSGYHNRLNRMVTDLGKENAAEQEEAVAPTAVAEVEEKPKPKQSLMGRIRSLATGSYKEKTAKKRTAATERTAPKNTASASVVHTPVKETPQPATPAPIPQRTAQPRVVQMPAMANGNTREKTEVRAEPEKNQETIHTVVRRVTGSLQAHEEESNELLEINGIGPSVLKRLQRIGICTFQDLASTSLPKLEQSFGEYAKLTDLGDWVDQAKEKVRRF